MKEHNIHVHFIRISSDFSNQRIDNFLCTYLKLIPRSMVYRIIRTGALRVNKKRIQFQYRLKTGDILRIPPIKIVNSNRFDMSKYMEKIIFLQKVIIYEDDDLLVLDKPDGIAVHGGSGLKFGVIEGLRALRPKEQFLELVHRLDRATSGLLLIAKKRTSLVYLHEQLRLQNIEKEYLALVDGEWDINIRTVSQPLLKTNVVSNGNRMVGIDSEKGKVSITHFKIKERFSNIATLLMIKPTTGRIHQIRAHTKYMNHPIVGDCIYGNCMSNVKFRKFGFNRLFLHASRLSFIHPNTNKKFRICAPLSRSFCDCLFFLRNLIVNK